MWGRYCIVGATGFAVAVAYFVDKVIERIHSSIHERLVGIEEGQKLIHLVIVVRQVSELPYHLTKVWSHSASYPLITAKKLRRCLVGG